MSSPGRDVVHLRRQVAYIVYTEVLKIVKLMVIWHWYLYSVTTTASELISLRCFFFFFSHLFLLVGG